MTDGNEAPARAIIHGLDPVPDDSVRDRRRHPIRWISLTVGFVVVMTIAVITGRYITRNPATAGSPLLGKPAPAIDLPRIDTAGTVQSWRFRGRVLIVDFWATWCVPCRRENHYLDEFYQRSRGPSVELVGILFADTPDAARQFRDEQGGTWPLVDDPTGSTAVAFGVTAVPETFIIDENGLVVARLIGAIGPPRSTTSSPNSPTAAPPSPTATTASTARNHDR